jgi:hypothetical protein
LQEIREFVRIIEQALDGLPEGALITDDRKIALSPRHELAISMEALIHHFKLRELPRPTRRRPLPRRRTARPIFLLRQPPGHGADGQRRLQPTAS